MNDDLIKLLLKKLKNKFLIKIQKDLHEIVFVIDAVHKRMH